MKRLTFLVVVFLSCRLSLNLDYQRQIQCESALDYIIQLVSEDRISDFDEDSLKRCTLSKCCLCGRQFRNTTFSAIHIALYHHQDLNHTQEINILFDDQVPTQPKYQFCHNYIERFNLTAEQKEEVCIIVSQSYYKPKLWLTVVKYILYAVVGLLGSIYYSDIMKTSAL